MTKRTKWDRSALEQMGILPSEAKFLAEVGMPNLERFELEFPEIRLPPSKPGTNCHQIGVFGMFNDMPLFIKDAAEGVWTFDCDSDSVLLNSSAKSFSQFVGLLDRRKALSSCLPRTLRAESVDLVQKAMAEIDPIAMRNDHLWIPFMDDLRLQETWFGE